MPDPKDEYTEDEAAEEQAAYDDLWKPLDSPWWADR
jgi:hypothetical protein